MRTVTRLALVGMAVGVGWGVADGPRSPAVTAAVSLDWSGPAAVRRGKPNAFTLTVANTGRVAAQRVTVQARPPADAAVVATDPPASPEDGVLVWDVGTLQPGEARPLAVTLTAGQRGELACPAWVTFTAATGMAVRVQEPKLEVALVTPATTAVGDQVDVAVVVTNTGDTPLDGADVSLITPNPIPVSLGDAGTTTAIDIMQQTCGPLAPGQSWTKQFSLRPGAPADWPITAEAQCRNEPGVRAVAMKQVRVVAPKLTASVTGPDKLMVGRECAYTVTVKNAGELAVDDARVAVGMPAGLRTAGPDRFDLGTLRPGEERTRVVKATAAAAGPQTLSATVTGSRNATAAAECRTAVDGVPALRVELLDTADPVEAGKETTYEVRVTNTGTKADENVVVTCVLPAALEVLSATGPTTAQPTRIGVDFDKPRPAGNPTTSTVVFDQVRELAPKTEAVFRVKAKAGAVGDARFKAVVTSKHLTAPVVKEESTRVYGD